MNTKARYCSMLRNAFLLAGMVALNAPAAVTVTPAELAQKAQWVQQNLLTAGNLPPFSFTYNGQASSTLLPAWGRSEADTILDTNRTRHVITWSNNTLQVSCVAMEYNDYPLVEWTVYLQNIGATGTPILQGIQGLDTTITRTTRPEFVLNGNQGDNATAGSYQPYQTTLNPSTVNNFSPPANSGKSCDTTGWPYYNLQQPGGGMILAIGWPGQWASSFTRDAGNDLRIQAGQQLTHLSLNPGEKIRTPLIALMFWQGTNVVRAQNIWRHWYIAHEIPQVNGQPPATISQVQGDSTAIVQSYITLGIQPNILWRDAGSGPGSTWYPSTNGPYSGNNTWLNTGNWVVDSVAYPQGFHRMSGQINALGVKFLLWFEPERIGNTINSFLATNNPAWILPATGSTYGDILNEGDSGAFNWLTNQIESLILANGINWYREDMNGSGPLPAWQNNDSANRQGITENFYVQGHLAYWDALLAMNPGLRIDCCGSGGRRNDLEAMSRAVPLDRSDFNAVNTLPAADGEQCQTYGLSSWLPFQGTGCGMTDPYSFRSSYMASFGMGGPLPQAYGECRQIAPIILNGDYYPLTPYSQADNVWMAWQFDWPGANDGCVQIFRRTNSTVGSMTFQLQGLNAAQYYDVSNFDTGDLGWFAGSNLMASGLTLQLTNRQSAILYYSTAQGVVASATASPQGGFAPLSVQFASTGIAANGAAVTYAWNFGDGATSTNQNPAHVYNKGGRYLANVTAGDGQGDTSSAQMEITVLGAAGHTMNAAFSGYANAETLTNFPVLVVFGTNLSANGFSYGQMASSNGWDLAFMNAAGTQPLNYEIEEWNTDGSSYVWVQVPILTSNAVIQAYWGDTNLAFSPSVSITNGSVWANGYADVWHLPNGVALSGTDSVAHGNNGTVHNASATGGVIGGAASFNGVNAYLDMGTAANPLADQQVTMSAWINPVSGTVIVMKGNDNQDQSYGLEWAGNSAQLFTYAGVPDWLTGGAAPAGQWSYITGIINGDNKCLYVNGALIASNSITGTFSSNPLSLWLGAQNRASYNYWYHGSVDEVRLSSVARSANWVAAEYMTMASNNVFSSYSAVTPYTPSYGPVNLTISRNADNVQIVWSAAATGAVLQESPDLVIWTNSTALMTTVGTNNTVTILPQGALKFYRLVY